MPPSPTATAPAPSQGATGAAAPPLGDTPVLWASVARPPSLYGDLVAAVARGRAGDAGPSSAGSAGPEAGARAGHSAALFSITGTRDAPRLLNSAQFSFSGTRDAPVLWHTARSSLEVGRGTRRVAAEAEDTEVGPGGGSGESNGRGEEERLRLADLPRVIPYQQGRDSGCRFPVMVGKESATRPRYHILVSTPTYGVVEAWPDVRASSLPWDWRSYWDYTRGRFVYHNWATNEFSDVALSVPVPNHVQYPRPVRDRAWRPQLDTVMARVREEEAEAEYRNEETPRKKRPGAHTRGVCGDDHEQWVLCKVKCEQGAGSDYEPKHYVGGIMPGLQGGQIRRRALLIGCSYPAEQTNSNLRTGYHRNHEMGGMHATKQVDVPTPLPNALEDLKKVYIMLVDQRGFDPSEIIVLTDGLDATTLEGRPSVVREIRNRGSLVEYSSSEKALEMMCALTSDLKNTGVSGWERASGGGKSVAGATLSASNAAQNSQAVAGTSLFFYFAGHGSSRDEFGMDCKLTHEEKQQRACEDDLRDEFIQLSDYKRVWIGERCAATDDSEVNYEAEERKQSFVDTGAIVDDVINRVLLAPVYETPNTQLLMWLDCCESGSAADPPFVLDTRTMRWMTSGQVRRDEIISGACPVEWDCGLGLVLVFSAAEDLTTATDMDGGFLTRALLESDVARPPSPHKPLTIGLAFRQIWENIWGYNQVDPGTFRQKPILSCSHFPSPDTLLYF